METRLRLSALFLLSLALIAFELSIMRVFAVGSWSNFGNLIISTALLGFGLAGAVLTFLEKSVAARPDAWLAGTAGGFTLTMALAQALSQRIPFEPTFMGADPAQLWWLALYYLVYGLPFVCGAAFIGICFVALKERIHQLYFWNMAGSGLGGFFIIVCMYLLPPARLVVPVMVLGFVATLLVMLKPGEDGRLNIPAGRFAAVVAVSLAAVVIVVTAGHIRVSDYKSISYARKYPELFLRHHSYSPAGEYHVFQSGFFHFAPGLSDNAALRADATPSQAFWALYVDGSGPIGIMGQLDTAHASYVDYLPMAAPYEIIEAPKALLVNLGGGINAQVARYKGASSVTVIEQDSELVKLMRDDPAVSAFTGKLLEDPRIQLRQAEARSWCRTNPGAYDLVDISLVDSIGLSDSGGYAVRENYTYTAEAIGDYLSGLGPDGLLSITVWNNLSPPRNVLRLLSTIVEGLKAKGVADPGRRIFMFDQLRSTATILVKNSDFTAKETDSLAAFVGRNSFNLVFRPGMEPVGKDVYRMVAAYRDRLEKRTGDDAAADRDFTPSELYGLSLAELLAGRFDKLQAAYVFDIRPMTDDRPYYSGYLKTGELAMYLGNINEISEEWGYLLQLGVLLQACIFGLLVILAPVLGRWKTVFRGSKGKGGVIAYFASLGLSYMLVEIFLMQRLVVFLGNPIFATSIVITAMLLISGLGNLAAPRIAPDRVLRVRIAVAGIIASLAFYMFGLPAVLSACQDSALWLRIVVAVVLIAPAAFCMGVPYPTGLEALTEKRPRLLPWAWGMNGGLSVAGTALAWIVSLASGFRVLLAAVMVLYLVVALLSPFNERTETGPVA
jgi:hypothetical protein